MTTTPAPGQFGVVQTRGLVAAAIRLLTRSPVSHAFLVIDHDHVIEAQRAGAVVNPLSKYDGATVAYSRLRLSETEVEVVIAEAEDLLGIPYNFLDLVALGLLQLGIRWRWLLARAQDDRRLICSQLVDRAYAGAGIHLYDDARPDGQVTPGDLLWLVATDTQPVYDS